MNLKGMNNQKVQKIVEKVRSYAVYAAKIAALMIMLVLNLAALALAVALWPAWAVLSLMAPSMTAKVLRWSFDHEWFIPILGIYRGYRWMPYYVKKKFFAKIGWGCEFTLKQSVRLYKEGLLSLNSSDLYCPKLIGGTRDEFLKALWLHGEITEAVIKAGVKLSYDELMDLIYTNPKLARVYMSSNMPGRKVMSFLLKNGYADSVKDLLALHGLNILPISDVYNQLTSDNDGMRQAITDGLEMHGQVTALEQRNLKAWEVYCNLHNICLPAQLMLDTETYAMFHAAGNTLDLAAKVKLLNSGNYELAEMIISYEDMTEMWKYISHDPKLVAMF